MSCESNKSKSEKRLNVKTIGGKCPNAFMLSIAIDAIRFWSFSFYCAFHRELKAAADRKERENLRILAEQNKLQELKNKRIAEQENGHHSTSNTYNFDMIDSGDSTDEEGKSSSKRPPPPNWSLSKYRLPYIIAQSHINSRVIDSFFSVEPRQVNLRDIFPTIDDKQLRRNSSAQWNTPPRYSLMPKY